MYVFSFLPVLRFSLDKIHYICPNVDMYNACRGKMILFQAINLKPFVYFNHHESEKKIDPLRKTYDMIYMSICWLDAVETASL